MARISGTRRRCSRAIRAKRSASFDSSIGCSCRTSRNRATASTGKRLSGGTISCSRTYNTRAIAGRGRCGKLHQPCDLLGRQAAEDGDRAIVYSVAWHRTNSWPPRGRRAAATSAGDAAIAVAVSRTRSARRRLKPRSRPFRRVTAILRSKASPALCFFSDASSKTALGRISGALLAVCFCRSGPMNSVCANKMKCDAGFGRRRPGAGSIVTVSAIAVGPLHGRQRGDDPEPLEPPAGMKQQPTLRLANAGAKQ